MNRYNYMRVTEKYRRRDTKLVTLNRVLCEKEFAFVEKVIKELQSKDNPNEICLILFTRKLQEVGYSIKMIKTIKDIIERDYKIKWV